MNAARLILAVAVALGLPAQAQTHSDTFLAGVVQHPATNIPPVQVVSRFALPLMSGGVNDFSGIASTDGVNVMLLSDHGFIVVGRLQRGYNQQIEGIDLRQVSVLTDENGVGLTGALHDSEGIAVAPDGSIFVSFEQHNRVLRYARLGAPGMPVGGHEDFPRLRAGRGLEALAVARDGTLYSIPERAARATYGFPSYRLQRGEWTGSFRRPMDGTFLPVGADFGPDGLLYVLERDGAGSSLRAQVRRFGINGRAISEPVVVMRSEAGQFGNLEGLSVYRDWNGRIRLLMVADDDRGVARSEIVDVVLNR